MGGTPQRMEIFARYIVKEIGYNLPTGTCLNDISKNSHRLHSFDYHGCAIKNYVVF